MKFFFWAFNGINGALQTPNPAFFFVSQKMDPMELPTWCAPWSGMGWSGIMEWNGVEWILVEDAFWSFWVILTLFGKFGPNLIVFD